MPASEVMASLWAETKPGFEGAAARDNPAMHRLLSLGLAALLVAACSPTFNWREVRAEGTPLRAMFPCKPDKAERSVPLAGHDVTLHALGCDTAGATFVVLFADIGDPAQAGPALDQWRQASLANIRGTASQVQPFAPPGSPAMRQSVRVSAQGQRADGSPVRSEAAYFARGSLVVQAMVFAAQTQPQWVDPFFEGLKLQ